jgi:hypothetical protein
LARGQNASHIPPTLQQSAAASSDDRSVSTKKTKSRWGRRGKDKEADKEEEVNEADLYHSPRPAFYAHTRPTRRTQVPRDVAVPYFRFRKDRFYDWPPDPTVSRATPLLATSREAQSEFEDMDSSVHHNSNDNDGQGGRGGPRRRNRGTEDVDYGYG